MPYSDITWSYKDPGDIGKLQQMADNAIWTSEHAIYGCELDVTSTDTCIVRGGRISIDGKWLVRTGTDTSGLALTASEASAWYSASGGECTSTSWYVVAFRTDNGFDCKFRLSGPAYSDTNSSTSPNGTLLYDKSGSTWMRYIGGVVNGTDSAFVKFRQQGDLCLTLASSTTFSIGNATTFTTLPLGSYYPALVSNAVRIGVISDGSTYGFFRHGEAIGSGLSNAYQFDAAAGYEMDIGWMHPTVTGNLNYKGAGGVTFTGVVTGWKLKVR